MGKQTRKKIARRRRWENWFYRSFRADGESPEEARSTTVHYGCLPSRHSQERGRIVVTLRNINMIKRNQSIDHAVMDWSRMRGR